MSKHANWNVIKRQILRLCLRNKKALKYNDDDNCSWCTWNGPQSLGKGTRRIGN